MTSFGAYEVIETVAVGSTGTVYRVHHREIDRIAAVKELNPRMRAVPGMLDRFRAEAQLLATLDHEHIVSVYDLGEDPGRVWIAEEWIDGVTVAALLAASGQLTPEQSLGVLRGALLGLAYAHDRNLVHRDFALSNILVDRAGTSKLIDFGLAAPVGQSAVCGTPAFMSPEAARGEPLGKASDVYSAAALLFTLLSGRVPFAASSADAVLQAQASTPPPALKNHGPALASLVADGMAKNPTARPPDARTFLVRLEEAARERYGAAWLSRASIAGLVAAGAGAVAAGVTSVGAAGTATSGDPATVYVDGNVVTGSARRVGRSSRKLIFGGVAAVAIAAAVTAIAVSFAEKNGKRTDAARGPSASVQVSGFTGTPSTVAQLVPKGVYLASFVITRTNIRGSKVGARSTSTWILDTTCTASVCTGGASSSTGDKFTVKFEGGSFAINRSDYFEGPCVYTSGPNNGKTAPGSLASARTTTVGAARMVERSHGPVPAAGVPLRLSGSGKTTVVYTVLKPGPGTACVDIPTETEDFTITLLWQR